MWKFWRSKKPSKPESPSRAPVPSPTFAPPPPPLPRPPPPFPARPAAPPPVQSAPVEWPSPFELDRLARGSNAFASDLWGQVRATLPGNLALSPASITLALAMAWGGARGETAAEMRRVLHLEGDTDEILGAMGKLLKAWNAGAGRTLLRVANRLFGEQRYTFEQPFLELTRATFGAPLEPVDFEHDPEAARGTINDRVARLTGNLIRELVPPGGVSTLTRLALVNAIYFKATWATPFEEVATRPEPFFLGKGRQKDVAMMHAEDTWRFAALDGVRLLELPYEDGETAMLFVLPDAVEGLEALEAGLTSARIDRWIGALKGETVTVSLPRFTVDPPKSIALAEALKGLGMERAFRGDADFTGIARPPRPENNLVISEVFHKAFVRLDEQGTEAAAATAVMEVEAAAMLEEELPKEFRADYPFLFLLRDRPSGMILFMGRVVEPDA